jgi:hypothetical protein
MIERHILPVRCTANIGLDCKKISSLPRGNRAIAFRSFASVIVIREKLQERLDGKIASYY